MDYFSISIKRIIFLGIGYLCLCTPLIVFAQQVVQFDGRVPGCGDGVIDGGESCDLSNLNGQSCGTIGFSSGILACTVACGFDTSACTISTGGGGGGGGSKTKDAESLSVFEGSGIPLSSVTLLIDGSVRATTTADQLGRFTFSVINLPRGTYQFGIFTTDDQGVKSSVTTRTVRVASRGVLKYSDIVIAPTLSMDMEAVTPGVPIRLFGFSSPQTRIQIIIGSSTPLSVPVTANGFYEFIFATEGYAKGSYRIQSQSFYKDGTSTLSIPLSVTIGDTVIPRVRTNAVCSIKGDINKDCKVNLIDFSIVLFWSGQTLSTDVNILERERLSGDEKIDFRDFSILLFYWTG